MSSQTTQSSGVTSVSYRFVLIWVLKGKDLNKISKGREKALVARSDQYMFKSAKDLRFYLEIEKSVFRAYEISIKGSKTWSFELSYAFVVSKQTVITLKKSSQLSFLPSYHYNNFSDEDDVSIHFVVIADPVHPSPSVEEDDLSLKEGQNRVEFEGRLDITLPGDYTNKMAIDFIRRGDIPSFEVDSAIQIISEMEEHKCELLKILCVRYLMANITAQSIRQISRAAIDNDLQDLERKCMEKIADGYIKVNF